MIDDTPQMPPDTRDLSPAQAGIRLGITPQRVRQLAREGRLPCTHTVLGRLIKVEDVERLRRERAEQATSRQPVGGVS